jgi:hypothetical protein
MWNVAYAALVSVLSSVASDFSSAQRLEVRRPLPFPELANLSLMVRLEKSGSVI